jgi:hypothetical protein
MIKINVCEEQWKEKIMPLSSYAYMAFMLLKFDRMSSQVVGFARKAKADELARMKWLGYLAGIPAEIAPQEVWERRTKEAAVMINEWLMEVDEDENEEVSMVLVGSETQDGGLGNPPYKASNLVRNR